MVRTNLDLAPHSKIVDGLMAVPIDIQHISAKLTFDGGTGLNYGDATMSFVMGPKTGNPIFDLRQSITNAWLDGNPLPNSKLAHHDFGGGSNAELRILESILTAQSSHTLRVKYSLDFPQASGAGSYLPGIKWNAGPRLVFNFGFTDLGGGRYLEAWIPANLIFDQFELDIELQVLNTAIAHTIITNGDVSSLGINHWTVNFPSRFTAFSPLVELRSLDTLINKVDTTVLPISGKTVSIEAWKLNNNPLDLDAQINHIKTWLANNEYSTGPYLHDGRFIVFLHQGGMEYEGGATSSPNALRHETFHSWWARGVKPASQSDAWFDEAWTVYNDNGATISFPFDFTDPPVVLCSRNPWVRHTTSAAYTDGNRFWEGVAAMVGTANLRKLMAEFYQERNTRPVTTTDIEEYLISRTGNPLLVDAFHRFVFGFGDSLPSPDLWLRDEIAHGGSETWPGRFWDSPDLWIRNSDDDGVSHQSPEYGQDNWFYARIHNRSANSTAHHFVVTFNVKSYAGTQFTYPSDFLPCIAAASGFELEAGESRIVKARWPRDFIPPVGTHACLLATVCARKDHPIIGKHVSEHNNLAQKNLSVVDLSPGEWILIPFAVANLSSLAVSSTQLELHRPTDFLEMEVSLVHPSFEAFVPELEPRPFLLPLNTVDSPGVALDCTGHTIEHSLQRRSAFHRFITSESRERAIARWSEGLEVHFQSGQRAKIPVSLRQQEQRVYFLKVSVPRDAHPGQMLKTDLIERDQSSQQILGGIAVEINVC